MSRKPDPRKVLRSAPPTRLTALAAGKINIGLRVGELRADGFHEVEGLVHTVSLADRIDVAVGGNEGVLVGDGVRLEVPGAPDLETGENLVARAAAVLSGGRDLPGVSIRLDKTIPIAAGLGGGSADAAATLAALNVVWGLGLDPATLIEKAALVSSDVPAIMAGGLVHISGRGEHVRGIGAASGCAFVLGISDERISAADAYRTFDAIERVATPGLHHNDLEAAAVRLVPALSERIASMRAAGAHPVFVSGSGPTVVGVATSKDAAREIASGIGDSFARIEVATPTSWGVRLLIGAEEPLIN